MVYLLVGSNKILDVDIYDECVYTLTMLYFAPYYALQSAYLYLNKPILLSYFRSKGKLTTMHAFDVDFKFLRLTKLSPTEIT